MKRLIADASFCGAWILEDEASVAAELVLQSLDDGTAELIVPSLWHYEMLNLLKMAHRRGRLDRPSVNAAQKALTQLPILEVDVPDGRANAIILKLAFDHELTAYDAAYLELAKRLKLPLYTLDRSLKKAALVCSVEVS